MGANNPYKGGAGRVNGIVKSGGSSKGSLSAILKLEGFDEVIDTLETLDAKLQKKVMNSALRAGSQVIAKDARRRAHKRSGKNAKWIKVKSIRRSRKEIGVNVQTGTRAQLGIPLDEKGYYPFTEEFGSKNHNAHPYMRPALATQRGAATKAIGNKIQTGIDKIAAKAKKAR